VARNRKRAKERRVRRPQGPASGPGVVTAPAGSAPPGSAPPDGESPAGAPDPIAHATPDVELVDAQLAVGRPRTVEAEPADEAEFEAEAQAQARAREAAQRQEAAAERRVGAGARLVGFLQGSWRELQRVQWPDRRQVVQATSVVIGFVIVAGVFLGVADFLAGHIVTFILNGHW